jgi:hydroxymethylpyrimidine/phosphomethylpyrimidine kinase
MSTSSNAPPVCLTVAGNDPSGGAGLAADLKTFAARGVYGMAALTVATDCETRAGVEEVEPMPPAFVRRQIARACADIPPQAAKTGMLFSEEIIRTVAEVVRERAFSAFVVDPVMTTRRGEPLLSEGAETALAEALLPLTTVATPSVPEAERLTGEPVQSRADMESAAAQVVALGADAAVVTGGHFDTGGEEAGDCFFDGDAVQWLDAERVPRAMHGAGDTLSAAIATELAKGHALPEAARQAKAYVTGAIRHAPELGHGNGPLRHAWETEVVPEAAAASA